MLTLNDDVALVYGVTLADNPKYQALSFYQNYAQTHTLDATAFALMTADNAVMLRFDPFDTATFIGNVYQQVLHRAPDAGGAAYWASQVAHGLTYEGVLIGIATSPEHVAQVWP